MLSHRFSTQTILLSICLTISFHSFCQDKFYVCHQIGYSSGLYELNLETCESKRLNIGSYTDIAFNPKDSLIYACRNGAFLSKINPKNGNPISTIKLRVNMFGLTFGPDNQLIGLPSAVDSIYEIDYENERITALGPLPPTFTAGGDVFFSNSKLYATSYNAFLHIDLNNFQKSKYVDNIGTAQTASGVATFGCSSSIYFGQVIPNNIYNKLISMDNFPNPGKTHLCNMRSLIINGATSTAENYMPPLELGPDSSICFENGSVWLDAFATNSTYEWSDGDSTPTKTVDKPGTYWVKRTNKCGTFSDTITITLDDSIHSGAFDFPDTSICPKEKITLRHADQDSKYLWEELSSINGKWNKRSEKNSYRIPYPSTYRVHKYNDCLKDFIDTLTVTYYDEKFIIDSLVDLIPAEACSNDSFNLNNTFSLQYSTYDSNQTYLGEGLHLQIPYLTDGRLILDDGQCQYSYAIKNTLVTPASIGHHETVLFCPQQDELNVTISDSVSGDWEFESYDQFPPSTGYYTFKGRDLTGCRVEDSLYFKMQCQVALYVPNAFSPNNDLINDSFQIVAEGIQSIHFLIYNEWGEAVFEGNSLEDQWDGTFNNQEVNSGAYVVLISYNSLSGESFQFTENLTLVR